MYSLAEENTAKVKKKQDLSLTKEQTQIKCTVCGKANYTEEECYKKQRIKALLVHDKDHDAATHEEQSITIEEHTSVVVIEDTTSIDKECAF